MRGEDILVLRPGFDPEAHLLPAGGARFVQALQLGATLAGTIDGCGVAADDLPHLITSLIAGSAISDIGEDKI